jgi:prepilin-type processing-associated H-X9-DG protein
MALAVHLYSDTHDHLPLGCEYPPYPNAEKHFPGISWHTRILPYIEQEALGSRAFAAYLADPRGYSAEHDRIIRVVVPTFLCPSEPLRSGGFPSLGFRWANTSYLGIAGTGWDADDGVFHPGLTVRLADITDGTSNTVMIGERPPGPHGQFGGWYSLEGYTMCKGCQILPANDAISFTKAEGCQYPSAPLPLRPGIPDDLCHIMHFWSHHPGGAHFAFADGSVRFLSYEVGDVLIALSTRAGREVVPFEP